MCLAGRSAQFVCKALPLDASMHVFVAPARYYENMIMACLLPVMLFRGYNIVTFREANNAKCSLLQYFPSLGGGLKYPSSLSY